MKSLVAQAAIAAVRPVDRQFARLTYFELNWMRGQRVFYDADKPLTSPEASGLVAHIAAHLGIFPPRVRATKRANPYCCPWGAVPTIYLRADHRQPYLIAHEVAHAATRTTMHPPAFFNRYIAALVAIGGSASALRNRMLTYGLNVLKRRNTVERWKHKTTALGVLCVVGAIAKSIVPEAVPFINFEPDSLFLVGLMMIFGRDTVETLIKAR